MWWINSVYTFAGLAKLMYNIVCSQDNLIETELFIGIMRILVAFKNSYIYEPWPNFERIMILKITRTYPCALVKIFLISW